MRRRFGLGLLGVLLLAVPAGTSAQIHTDMVLLTRWDTGPGARLTVDLGVAGIWQRIAKLGTTASVLYTTGHPDDEEAGILTLLSRGMGVRTGLLFSDRENNTQSGEKCAPVYLLIFKQKLKEVTKPLSTNTGQPIRLSSSVW